MATDLGALSPVLIRNIWPNEAHDFTPWLADNLSQLAEILNLEGLELIEREAAVGSFSLDLLAKEPSTGKLVVIENQFGNTDHDHLGKLLTYAAGTEANLVIWVTETLRDEHREALEWLNRHTDEDTQFFAVSVEAIRIDNSRPAIRFVTQVQPNEWQRQTRILGSRAGTSERSERYRGFFQKLVNELRDKHRFTKARLAQPQSWYTFSSGIGDVRYEASFAQQGKIKAALYIGSNDSSWNKAVFDKLREDSKAIEVEFGSPLSWERLDHRVASRIACCRTGSLDATEEDLVEYQTWFVNSLLKLKAIFDRRLPLAISQIENVHQ